MSDDATDRPPGISIRMIRQWRAPTPAEEREDLERFARWLEAALARRRRAAIIHRGLALACVLIAAACLVWAWGRGSAPWGP